MQRNRENVMKTHTEESLIYSCNTNSKEAAGMLAKHCVEHTV